MILALASTTAAYAATRGARNVSAVPAVNLVAAAKGCAVIHVALHGTKPPTITCQHRTWPSIPAGHAGNAIYSTPGEVPCNSGSENLEINTYNRDICWSGSGYLPINPTLAQVAVITANNSSWVRLYYNGAGTFFNAAAGGGNEMFFGPYGAFQNVSVTQICDNCTYHG
jgi:hypothetical protein